MSKTDSQLVGQLYDHVRQLCGLCAVLRLAQSQARARPNTVSDSLAYLETSVQSMAQSADALADALAKRILEDEHEGRKTMESGGGREI